MNHHVPRVPVQPVSPVVVALQRREGRKFYFIRKKNYIFKNSVCGSRAYLRDEVGIRHEKLLKDVHDCKNSSQLVLQSWFGDSCSRRGLLAFAAAAGVAVNTGSAGLRARRGDRQNRPEVSREAAKESSRPVGVAEQGTGGQHGVGKHPCGGAAFPVRPQKKKTAPELKYRHSLTDAEELRVHAVEVGDKEYPIRPRHIEEEQVAGAQVQEQAPSVHHQQTDQLHREDHSEKRRCAPSQTTAGGE